MSVIKRTFRKYKYNEVRKKHDKYFVTYYPINRKKEKFASLHITFTQLVDSKEATNIMEKEFDKWISQYPLPIMVTSFDDKGDVISFKNNKESNHLIGYLNKESNRVIKYWDMKPFPKVQLTDAYINLVYNGLSYKKRDDIEKESETWIKDKRRIVKFVDTTLILWLIISVVIAFLGWRSLLVGTTAFIYSLYRTIRRFLKLKGCKTKREKDDQENMRKMNHYYYHCERNPKGFRRLIAENFEEDEKERIKKERESIKN